MTNNKDHSEEFIKNLVQKTELERPSDGFADNIMKKIHAERQEEAVVSEPTFTVWQLILIIVPGIILVGGAFYYYRQYFTGMFESGYITETIIPYVKEIFARGSELLSKQEFSPILLIVIVSAGFLMIIDRFIHFGRRMRSYLFVI